MLRNQITGLLSPISNANQSYRFSGVYQLPNQIKEPPSLQTHLTFPQGTNPQGGRASPLFPGASHQSRFFLVFQYWRQYNAPCYSKCYYNTEHQACQHKSHYHKILAEGLHCLLDIIHMLWQHTPRTKHNHCNGKIE